MLLQHSIPEQLLDKMLFCLWGNQAVPIFFIIQSFHAYKKGATNVSYSLFKLWKRIIGPFFLVLSILFVYTVVLPYLRGADISEKSLLFLQYGGPAPGSYYVWIYLQMVLVIILCSHLFKWKKKLMVFVLFLFMSILLEMICSIVSMAPITYRLLFFRYFFLIWIGYYICNEIIVNKSTVLITLVSAVSIIVFRYSSISFEPIFVTTEWGWTTNHWICYPFCIFLIWLFRKLYLKTQILRMTGIVELCGKYSYEIFLWQMLYFVLPIHWIINKLIVNDMLSLMLYVIVSPVICIVPILYVKERGFLINVFRK